MNRWMMGALVLLGGCSAPPTDENPGIDTGIPIDTGEPEFTCETLDVRGTLDLGEAMMVPAGPGWIELVWVDLRAAYTTGAVRAQQSLGTLVAGSTVDFAFCIDNVPSAEEVYVLSPNTDPDFRVGTWVVRAWTGPDAATVDQWVGTSLPQLLVWAEGTLPQSWIDEGLTPGWNLADPILAQGTPFVEGSTWQVPAQLLPQERPGLQATIGPDLSGESNLAVGLWNINTLVDGSLAAPAELTVGAESFTPTGADHLHSFGTLGAPPADHIVAHEPRWVRVGYYMGVAWSDTDGDGSFESGESLHANTTSATPRLSAWYLEAVDWRVALDIEQGWVMGWNLVDNNSPAAWDDGLLIDAP